MVNENDVIQKENNCACTFIVNIEFLQYQFCSINLMYKFTALILTKRI